MSESEKTSGRASDAERVDRRRGSVATTRRRFLAAGATASALSLGGCLGDSSGRDGDTGGSTDADGGTDASPGGVRTGTASSTDYPDEVVIGSNHPLTGATSYQGERLHNAVKLAAAIKNENGGIESMDGATVRVATGDHKNDPTLGGEVAKELVDEGADVLTGCFSSSCSCPRCRTSTRAWPASTTGLRPRDNWSRPASWPSTTVAARRCSPSRPTSCTEFCSGSSIPSARLCCSGDRRVNEERESAPH